MNNKNLLAFLSFLLIGCAEQYNFSVESECNNEAVIFVSSELTRSFSNSDSNSVYFVTEKDLDSYIKYKRLSLKKEELNVDSITPVTDNSGDVWAYAINYSEGWELISADKRYPPIIAHSPVGHFKFEEQIEPITEWLGSVSEDIKLLRRSENLSGIFTESSFEQMASYQEFWKMITANPDYIEDNRIKTRVHYDPDGRWELTDVVIDTVEYQRVDHLITTHWHQNSPYNAFCPLKSYSSTYRAPAGCVAIAGAQTAYYLHGKIGLPANSPLNAYCVAQIPSSPGYYIAHSGDPQMYVSNFSSTAWNAMATDDAVIAALIAYTGICVSMVYEDWQSASNISALIIWYFINNGISCSYCDLNNSGYFDLYDNIINELPVVARASCVIDGESEGHAFIIDGYKNERVRITAIYSWVPTDPLNANYYEDQIQITYRPPINHQITMNWGWGNDYPYDAGWYAPAGDWHVDDCSFNHNKKIIYNFHNTP